VSSEPHPKDEALTPLQQKERADNIEYTRAVIVSGSIGFNIGIRREMDEEGEGEGRGGEGGERRRGGDPDFLPSS